MNRLFFYYVIIIASNKIGGEGAKALAEALKLNKYLTKINLGKFLLFLTQIITIILSK